MKLPLVVPSLLLVVSCAGGPAPSVPGAPPPRPTGNPWTAEFEPPTTLDTPRLHLEVLRPELAGLDHAAFMSSREHLQRTLHWGSWPSADATVEQNRADLARHLDEFEKREAYAYTVLTPDRSRCVGCIYVNPSNEGPSVARTAYWVVERELANDLDEHLLASVFGWFDSSWPFDTVVMPLHVDNERGLRIAEELGLELSPDTVDDHREARWQRR